MKLKGLTKLALSGVALAAVAATLGTSTYAWYISNDTATVTGANGSTATMAADGSIYAANAYNKSQGVWKNQISLAKTGSYIDFVDTPLVPVTRATADKNTAYNGKVTGANLSATTGFADKKGVQVAQGDGAYMTIAFWLMARGAADSTVIVTPELTVTNNTTYTNATKQSAYATDDLPTIPNNDDPGIGDQFAIDAVLALRMEITKTEEVSGALDTANAVTVTDIGVAEVASSYASPASYATGGAANLYYNDNVNGVNLYGCAATTGAGLSTDVAPAVTSWTNVFNYGDSNANNGKLVLNANVPTKLEFKIWLEGTDAQCYDSAVGQAFSFDFKFVKQGA